MINLIDAWGDPKGHLSSTIQTVEVETHSFYSDRPEKWAELVETIRTTMLRHLKEFNDGHSEPHDQHGAPIAKLRRNL